MYGSFQNLGTSARVFHIENGLIAHSEQIHGKKSSQLKRSKGEYLIWNVYYKNKKYPDFLRAATTISGQIEDKLQLGLVDYHFPGTEHSVNPHKNPHSGKSFVPTAPSTSKAIKKRAKSYKGPSSIFVASVENTRGNLTYLWSHGGYAKRYKAG